MILLRVKIASNVAEQDFAKFEETLAISFWFHLQLATKTLNLIKFN